jgi:hypothetical protein
MPRRRLGCRLVQHTDDPGGHQMTTVADTIRNGVDTEKMFATWT